MKVEVQLAIKAELTCNLVYIVERQHSEFFYSGVYAPNSRGQTEKGTRLAFLLPTWRRGLDRLYQKSLFTGSVPVQTVIHHPHRTAPLADWAGPGHIL
jgi:hypothetical protein